MTSRKKAELVLLATTAIWGGTFVVMKLGFADVSPFLFVAIRFTLGTIIFGSVFFPRLRSIRRSTVRKGAILGVLLGVGLILQTYGLQITTASKSAFITGMMVVFTPAAQMVIGRRLPQPGNLVGGGRGHGRFVFSYLAERIGLQSWRRVDVVGAFLFGFYIVYLDIYSKEEELLPLGVPSNRHHCRYRLDARPFRSPSDPFHLEPRPPFFLYCVSCDRYHDVHANPFSKRYDSDESRNPVHTGARYLGSLGLLCIR